MRRALATAALGVLVLGTAGGCSRSSSTAAAHPTASPTVAPTASASPPSPADQPPTPASTPPAPSAPPAGRAAAPGRETPAPLPSAVTAPGAPALAPCSAPGLSALLVSVSAGSGGDQAAFVELRNTTGAACQLHGEPVVQMLSTGGTPLPTAQHPVALYRPAPVALPAGTAAIRPGALTDGHAYLAVVFNAARDRQGGLCNPPDVTIPAALTIALPSGGGTMRVDATAADGSGKKVQSCRGQLGVSVFASKGTAATQ